jgi:hypothetical protein
MLDRTYEARRRSQLFSRKPWEFRLLNMYALALGYLVAIHRSRIGPF